MGILPDKKEKITIQQKQKINELLIYTCGNPKEIKKFIQKELRKNDFAEIYTDYIQEIYPNKEWYFNCYLNEMNDELINGIMRDISGGYRNKMNSNNNIILVFLNSNEKENKNKIKIILENLEEVNKIYKPFVIFAFRNTKMEEEEEENNEERKENIIDDVIKENGFNNYFIKKYIEMVEYKENDYSKLLKKINSIYCYYNNIGDIYTILDEIIRGYNSNNNKSRNTIKFVSTFNILVLGRPGSGKSTLINLLLNKKKAREGIGESITQVVSKYVHDKYPITFEDTPGFEDDQDLEKMITFLTKYNDLFKKGKNRFHLILYLINGSSERTFIGQEVQLINFIKNQLKIPIFFVCTRSKNKEYAKDFKEILKMNLWQNFGEETNLIDHIYCCNLLNEKDGVYKRFGIDELLEGIRQYYMREIEKKENELFIETKKNSFTPIGSFEMGNDTQENSIFLSGLKNVNNFEDYLNDMALQIIEEYKYLTYLEESKKNDNKNNKINELLVDHLALELNGKSSGHIFCRTNKNIVYESVEVITPSGRCSKTRTENEYLKGKTIKEKEMKKSIRITKEFGMEATKQFLNQLRNEAGFEKYLKAIIKSYKEAIESLNEINQTLK